MALNTNLSKKENNSSDSACTVMGSELIIATKEWHLGLIMNSWMKLWVRCSTAIKKRKLNVKDYQGGNRKPNRNHRNATEQMHFGPASWILCAVLVLPSQKALAVLEKAQRRWQKDGKEQLHWNRKLLNRCTLQSWKETFWGGRLSG